MSFQIIMIMAMRRYRARRYEARRNAARRNWDLAVKFLDACRTSQVQYPKESFPKDIAVLKNFTTMVELAEELKDEFYEASTMEYIQTLFDKGIIMDTLIQWLQPAEEIPRIMWSLKMLCYTVKSSDQQKDYVLKCGLLAHLEPLLTHQCTSIQAKAARILSSFMTGQQHHIQAVIDAPNLIPALINMAAKEELKAQKAALLAIRTFANFANRQQICCAIEFGVFEALCSSLDVAKDITLILTNLEIISSMLAVERSGCARIEACYGWKEIAALLKHENSDVRQAALSIIDEYYRREGLTCNVFGPVPYDVTCPVCNEVNAEPYQLGRCQHHLCMGCLAQILTTNSPSCPVCRIVIEGPRLDLYFKHQIIGSLPVLCGELRCRWTGDLVSHDRHHKQCLMEELTCECGVKVQRCHLAEHRASRCSWRPFSSAEFQARGQHGVTVKELVEFLDNRENQQLRLEAVQALCKIASGYSEETRAVINAGAVPKLISILSVPNDEVWGQTLSALASSAADCAEFRDVTICCGIIQPLLELINEETPLEHIRKVVWTISKLCRLKNPPFSTETVRQLLSFLVDLLVHSDKEVFHDACLALSYLLDGSVEHIQTAIDANVVEKLIQLLPMTESSCMVPLLQAVGSTVTGSDQQTQHVLDCGLLAHFEPLLTHQCTDIQAEALRIVSNITAGQEHQIQLVINANLIPAIIRILREEREGGMGELNAQEEALRAVYNIACFGNVRQILHTIDLGAIDPLCNLLDVDNTRLIQSILYIISKMLAAGQYINQVERVWELILECEGLTKICSLMSHTNQEVKRVALKIMYEHSFFSQERVVATINQNTSSR